MDLYGNGEEFKNVEIVEKLPENCELLQTILNEDDFENYVIYKGTDGKLYAVKDVWYCIDLAALFNAKVDKSWDENYAQCQFGGISKSFQSSNPEECYYDFGNNGMSLLCCDGENVKLISIDGDICTFLSDGNSYEEEPEDYYFKLTKEEAKLAGVQI